MNIYTPDGWEMIKHKDDYYIFGSWSGGYLDGNTWRRNSGVTRVEESDTHYYFYGFTGSCYVCHKEHSHISSYNLHVLSSMIKQNDAELVDQKDIPSLFEIEPYKGEDNESNM